MRITLRDISRTASVSISTVSDILNSRPAGRYSDEVRSRVIKTAHELGYRPNSMARSLRKQKSETIGVILPNRSYSYFGDIAIGIEKYAKLRGYHVITAFTIYSGASKTSPLDELHALNARQVDGLIVTLPGDDHYQVGPYNTLIEKGVPIVCFDQIVEEVKASFVGTDDVESSKEAIRYLTGKGHRRIAILSGSYFTRPQGNYTTRSRFQGYQSALEDAGIPLDSNLIFDRKPGDEDFREPIRRLLSSSIMPTAVFCTSDVMAGELYLECWRRGIKIPDDISIMGFSGLMMSEYLIPPLTTMQQQPDLLAKKLIEVLFEQIHVLDAGERLPEPEKHLIKAELVERNSIKKI